MRFIFYQTFIHRIVAAPGAAPPDGPNHFHFVASNVPDTENEKRSALTFSKLSRV